MLTKKRVRFIKKSRQIKNAKSSIKDNSKLDNDVDQDNFGQDVWAFKKLNNKASHFTVVGNKVTFGLPKYQMTIYPHQSARLNTGWQLNQLPVNTAIHTIPNQYLLNYNLLAFPQIKNASNQGEQMTINLLNNGTHPVSVVVEGQQIPSLCICENGSLRQLQFDFGSLFTSILSTASEVVPLFL